MKKGMIREAAAKLMLVPLFDSEQADEVLHGTEVTVLEEIGSDWLKVRTEYRYEGFLPVRDMSFRLFNERQMVCHSFADVLAKPKVQAKRLKTLPMGSFVKVVSDEVMNTYVKVELADGIQGYIKQAFLQKEERQVGWSNQSEIRKNIIDTAFRYQGAQYRWGGKTPEGIDCSGLCFMSYFLNGITIYRDARIEQGFPVKPIERKNMKAADLIYFPGHIALCIGEQDFIHSSFSENGVSVNSLSPENPFYRKDLATSVLAIGSVFV